jgi:glutathione S-transferase
MKLYFSPGACSLSPHIVSRELGLPVELVKVDTKAGRTAAGADYKAINPKGAVPALQLDDGSVLTEGAVIVQYLADQRPDARLLPAAGSAQRYKVQEWLNYIASDLHKGCSPLFSRVLSDEVKAVFRTTLEGRLAWVATQVGERFLLGDYGVADAYLFTILAWSPHVGIDLKKWPALQAYFERVGARPAVKAALAAEQAARAS